jgi:putative tryptophan/tyrosine transport system substrate-binding protein
MRRREFILTLGGTAIAWPVVTRAQQLARPVIGFLNGFSQAAWELPVRAFREGLKEQGFVEGQNVVIAFRWADGQYDRLPALVAELVRLPATVLVATGGSITAVKAKAGTATTPIVFGIGGDPVALGLVKSFNQPRGNATGVYFLTTELDAKRLGLLRQLVPKDVLIAALLNPTLALAEAQFKEVMSAASEAGQQMRILHASSEAGINAAFAEIAELRAAALLVAADPFFLTRREHIVELAARYAIPAIYEQREFALAGGLMSYGTSLTEATRQVGVYTGRVLKDEKPAGLPVLQSAIFEFVINVRTAKLLNLTVPQGLLNAADEVIE